MGIEKVQAVKTVRIPRTNKRCQEVINCSKYFEDIHGKGNWQFRFHSRIFLVVDKISGGDNQIKGLSF